MIFIVCLFVDIYQIICYYLIFKVIILYLKCKILLFNDDIINKADKLKKKVITLMKIIIRKCQNKEINQIKTMLKM
jgi:hypothetical protein